MMAEAEALNGIFAPDDDRPSSGTRARASPSCRIRSCARRRTRAYEIDETFDLADVAPMIAKPFSPGNAFPAEEVARERITFDKAMIGSCTNGSYDDLLQAALVIRAARAPRCDEGRTRASRSFRDRAASAADRAAGSAARRRVDRRGVPRGRRRDPPVVVRPVLRPGPGRADAGQRAITSFNRNWQNRMGLGGEGYLASPAVVAASALVGYMAPPSELGSSGIRTSARS